MQMSTPKTTSPDYGCRQCDLTTRRVWTVDNLISSVLLGAAKVSCKPPTMHGRIRSFSSRENDVFTTWSWSLPYVQTLCERHLRGEHVTTKPRLSSWNIVERGRQSQRLSASIHH